LKLLLVATVLMPTKLFASTPSAAVDTDNGDPTAVPEKLYVKLAELPAAIDTVVLVGTTPPNWTRSATFDTLATGDA
jgi:hypothetical protein